MNATASLLALLVFPGLAYAVPAGWLMLGLERKLRGRFQGRLGPPLTQPFYDFVKLLGKWPVARDASEAKVATALPLLAVGSTVGALALLPVSRDQGGFAGDIILLVGLLELPPACLVLAGYASRSIYGQVGATREAVLSIASNVPFLAALVAMATAAGSLQTSEIALATPWMVRVPALASILFCLPVKLRTNPFSIANAEQEILAGPLTEADGPRLALWELAHALEWVALAGFAAALALPPRSGDALLDALGFALVSFALVPLVTLVASATARLKIRQVTRLLWRGASLAAAAALALAAWAGHGGP